MVQTVEKYCRDCFHARDKYSGVDKWSCAAPQNSIGMISLVTGTPIPLVGSCLDARNISGACGQEGRWFLSHVEVKKSSWSMLEVTGNPARKLRNTTVEDI